MFNPVSLDERERVIFNDADSYKAHLFLGRGQTVRLGPFDSQEDALKAIRKYYETSLATKPFTLYACSSVHTDAHVALYNVTRDGPQETRAEFMQRLQEQRTRESKERRRSSKT